MKANEIFSTYIPTEKGFFCCVLIHVSNNPILSIKCERLLGCWFLLFCSKNILPVWNSILVNMISSGKKHYVQTTGFELTTVLKILGIIALSRFYFIVLIKC